MAGMLRRRAMNLLRVRFTVRSLMVVVAVVALSIWAKLQLDARSTYFRQLVARYYDKRYAAAAFGYSGPGGAIMEARLKADEVRRAKASAYYSNLIQKYERAARYPWLPVASDPPKPDGIDDNQIIVK
jgi:hypothetical protein